LLQALPLFLIYPVNHSGSQPASQPASQSVSQPVSQSVREVACLFVDEEFFKWPHMSLKFGWLRSRQARRLSIQFRSAISGDPTF